MRKKILITGGSGFIGRNLVEQLGAAYTVIAPRRSELELLDTQGVKKFLRAQRCDVIIHSATIPSHRKIKEPRDVAYRNLKIFFNIARNYHDFGKLIFLGSGAEYGQQEEIKEVRETDFDSRIPDDEHGFSKYICSKYIEKMDNFVNLRLFGVFGKYEDYQIRFISNAICKALFSLPITLCQNRRFSYLYIEDLGQIVSCFIEHTAKEKCYNAVPMEKVELLALAELVKKVSGKDINISVAKSGMGAEYTANNTLLSHEVKNLFFTPIEEAVQELYAWYENTKSDIKKELLTVDP